MTQMAQEGSEEVMDEETVSRDAEMELLGEPQADVDGMKGTEELTEDQIYDLLGDEGPPTVAAGSEEPVEQNIQDSPDPLEEHPPTEEKEEEPTSSVKLTGEAEVDAVEEVEIAEEEDDVVSSTEQIDEDQSSQDAEPTFTAHDLLAGEDDEEDGIVMEDDLGIIEQDVESTSSIRNSWFQNDDDDIFVEEEPTTSYSTDIPLLNRLSRQMLRSYLDRLAVKDPEQIYLMSVKSDVGKLKTTLSTHNHQTQAMRAAYTSREQEILLELAKEKQKNLELMTRLSTANFKLNEHPRRPRVSQHIDDADHSKTPLAMPPTRSRSFTALKRQATAARSQPYVLSRTPRQTSVSAAPEPPVPESNVSLPTRIIVTLPLVENLRQCPVTDPFDAKPLNDYPPGLLKALHNRTGRVEVLLKTEYDCFLISKKLHGVVKFQLPEGLALPSTAFIRLYYLVESMHDSWLFSSAAKISETGTKFTLGFHGDQRLYMGDRVSFIAYIYLDQQTKFVSEQAVFKMRRPVVQISADTPIDLP